MARGGRGAACPLRLISGRRFEPTFPGAGAWAPRRLRPGHVETPTMRISKLALSLPLLLSLGWMVEGPTILSAADPRPGTGLPQREDAPTGVRIAKLQYGGGGDWYSNPSSLPNLMRRLASRTTVPVRSFEEKRVTLLDERLFDYPFIYMNGHGVVRFTADEAERLRTYLLTGGFLFADDNYGMDKSFRQEIQKVFPDKKLVDVPHDHRIFHSFYDLPRGVPKVHEHDGKPAQGLGIFHDGRLVVFYTYQADIGDGLEDSHVHNDPPAIREEAMKMAINVVIYALTS